MAAETGPAHASNARSPTSLTNTPRGPQPESEQDGESVRGPEALGSLLSRADSAGRTRLILQLQHQQGNQQVQRLLRKNSLVQRAPPTTPSDPIQTALKSKRQEDVIAIQDVGKATDDQCIQLIQILANQSQMDGKGRRLSELWGHFAADKLPTIASAHMAEWKASVTVFPALPNMLPAVSAVEGAFSAAVRGVAEANLTQNDDYVRQQLELIDFA